ncbi:MAG TPA: hypothetical protein VIV11_15110 [Kofleriaceae bacterium]
MKWVIAAALLVSACSRKETATGSACRPVSVTVDGAALPALPKGLAKANNMNGDISYEVQLFNHDKVTCEDMLNKAGRPIPDGEISVRAFAAGAGMTGKGIAIDSHTQMGGPVTLLSDKPKAAGDVVKVCVDNAAFKPIAGRYKDKDVVVTGLFEGTYCGEMQW